MKQTILKETNFSKLKNLVKKNKGKTIIFTSDDDDFNRIVLEKLPINIILISQSGRKDFQKQRNSGFNHVLARIAKKNKIDIGINLDEIIETNQHCSVYTQRAQDPKTQNSGAKQKAEILARVQQNIKLCNKNKLKMKFISPSGKVKRNSHDLKALGLVLGMPTWMTKDF